MMRRAGLSVATLLLLGLTPLAWADAENDFEMLFGKEAKAVTATADTRDDVIFAQKVLKAAQSMSDVPASQAYLCRKAYEFALKSPAGCDVAIEAALERLVVRGRQPIDPGPRCDVQGGDVLARKHLVFLVHPERHAGNVSAHGAAVGQLDRVRARDPGQHHDADAGDPNNGTHARVPLVRRGRSLEKSPGHWTPLSFTDEAH